VCCKPKTAKPLQQEHHLSTVLSKCSETSDNLLQWTSDLMCPCLNCSSGKDNVSSYAQQTRPSREVCVMYTTVSPAQIAEPIIGGDRLALVVNLVFDKGAPCTLAPPGEYDAPICVALSDNVARHHQQPVIAINQAMSSTHDCIHRSSWISLLMYSRPRPTCLFQH